MIVGLSLGLSLGLVIRYISLSKKRSLYKEYVETFKELSDMLEKCISIKDMRINVLSVEKSYYKQGYQETIKQNIELKKMLGRRTV